MSKQLLCICLFLIINFSCPAQLTIGFTGSLGYPFQLKDQGYYNTSSIGNQLSIAYIPEISSFSPFLSFKFAAVQFPLKSPYSSGLNLYTEYFDLTLGLDKTIFISRRGFEWVVALGIGVFNVNANNVQINIGPNTSELRLQSQNKYLYHPHALTKLGFLKRVSEHYPWYWGMGVELSLLYFSKSKATFSINDRGVNWPIHAPDYLIWPQITGKIVYQLERK